MFHNYNTSSVTSFLRVYMYVAVMHLIFSTIFKQYKLFIYLFKTRRHCIYNKNITLFYNSIN